MVDNHKFFSGASISISVFPENGTSYLELMKALRDTKKLHKEGFLELIVSINISYFQIQNDNFLNDFKKIVDKA